MTRHRHLGQPLAATIPAFARMSQCGNCCNCRASAGSGSRASRERSRSPKCSTIPNSLAHALHNFGIGHQLGGDREATFAAAHRAAALAEKFGLLPWRAGSLLLAGLGDRDRRGVADAARLIDAEIANATASVRCRNIFWASR